MFFDVYYILNFFRVVLFNYLKLFLILIIVFIGTDVQSKSMVVLLFLIINTLLRYIDKPFFTNHLNEIDLNASISLLLIYYGLILANSFDSYILDISVLIFLMVINFQFLFSGLKILSNYVLYALFLTSQNKRIKIIIPKIFQSIMIFYKKIYFIFKS